MRGRSPLARAVHGSGTGERMKPGDVVGLLKDAFNEWSEDNCSRLAAALAYYTVFSIAPLLLIAIAVAGYVFGDAAAQGQVFAQLRGLLGPEAASMIQTAVQNARNSSGGTISTIVGVVTLLLSASGLFSE